MYEEHLQEIIWTFLEDVLHFADLGFKQISIEPVVGPEDTDPYAIREEDLPKIFEEYDKLAKIMVERRKGRKRFYISSTL